MQVYTTTLSAGEITINKEDGVSQLSIQPNADSACLFTGNMTFKGANSTSLALGETQVFTVSSQTASSPLDGITITWVSGTVEIVMGF